LRFSSAAGTNKRARLIQLRWSTANRRALLSLAQLAIEPTVYFHVLHRIGLTTINAVKFAATVEFLRPRQLGGLLAFGANRRIGLDLWHDASPWMKAALRILRVFAQNFPVNRIGFCVALHGIYSEGFDQCGSLFSRARRSAFAAFSR
jgi:hypothetical protein